MTTNTYSSIWFQLFMPRQTEELTRNEVAFLTRQLPLPRYRRVLDLCCGLGRHAIGLAGQGYEVTGLDRDEAAIAEARRRAQAAGASVSLQPHSFPALYDPPGGNWSNGSTLGRSREKTNAFGKLWYRKTANFIRERH